ncbi:MAG: DegQ family serine endoprotease [Desulfuromonadales bacterium]
MISSAPRFITFLAILLVCSIQSAKAASSPDFVAMANEHTPAVVNISTSKTITPQDRQMPGQRQPVPDFFDEFFERFFQGHPQRPRKQRSLGSGFIISRDGFILTNEHVVKGADEVEVRLSDGRTFTATIKGLDPKLDLGLLKIDTEEDLPVAELGDSEGLKTGEWVMAIGNPFGLDHTVTVGIVSAKGRVIGAGPYDNFIQTDASINPGNSGGPLFNTRGEVVGINTAIVARAQGIGFATPINAAKRVLPQLKEKGEVVRGWLGVSIQEISDELAESFGLDEKRGALVSGVVEGSPAEEAGLKRGDITLSFNGRDIEDMTDLPRMVAATDIGEEVELTIFRDGRERTMTATIGKLEESEGQTATGPEPQEQGRLGVNVTELTPQIAERYGIEAKSGLIVTRVAPTGPAAEANLRSGDLIVEMNGKAVESIADFRSILTEIEKGQVVRLLIQRGENLFYTTVKAG